MPALYWRVSARPCIRGHQDSRLLHYIPPPPPPPKSSLLLVANIQDSKMGILVITVDLECCRCKAKITKVLDCLKEEFRIEKVEFEDKNNRVVVRGKFDAEKLCKMVWCKACKIVKEIHIVEVWPMPPPPKPCPNPCKPKPDPGHKKQPDPGHKKQPDPEPCKKPDPCKKHDSCCKDPCCKPRSDPCKPCEIQQPPPPPAKTEYKLVPYPYPYPLPYPGMCQSWPRKCPPEQPCHCCQQKPPTPPPQPPCTPPVSPCQCCYCGQQPCSCGGRPPMIWPPLPPWAGTVVADDNNSCSIM